MNHYRHKDNGAWMAHKDVTGRNRMWTHKQIIGVSIKHCGHPTALTPYFIDGIPGLGTFRRLADAQAAVVSALNEVLS